MVPAAPKDTYGDSIAVPEEPFGIAGIWWKRCLIVFSLLLAAGTAVWLADGGSAGFIGTLYVIPAILFAYFYRRRGVLAAYVLAMFYLALVILFRFPSADDLFGATIRSILLVAIALTVSYLTYNLLLEKRKYEAIFDNTENGILVIDCADLSILEMNQRFALTAGVVQPVRPCQGLATFIRDAAAVDRIREILSSPASTPAMEMQVYRPDGTIWTALVVARRISEQFGVLTFIDFSERKLLDERLRRTQDDTNLYLDILTHDINNINTAGLNYAHLLQVAGDESRPRFATRLLQTLEKSDSIIRNISALRRLEEGTVRQVPVPLDPVIRKEIAGYPESRIRYEGSGVTVIADELLSSVFNNLLDNAIKFQGHDPEIGIRVEDRGAEVSIAIVDNGRGIPDTLKPHVFERYQRGDTTVSGKGLGLFICRALVERYGGRISAEDRVSGDPLQGSLIRVILRKP